jgi:hypothetical protein
MRISLLLPAFGLALALVAGTASATTYVVSGNGLIAPNQNYGCPAGSANCLTSKDYDLVGTAAATGTIVVDPTVATLSLDVASVQFSPTGGGANVAFTNVHYSGTVTVFTAPSIVSQTGFATGSVSGLLDGNPFTAPAIVTNLTCTTSGSSGNCSVMFGPSGFSVGGQDWLHTFTVLVAVPEPALALLALLGVAGPALRARRV